LPAGSRVVIAGQVAPSLKLSEKPLFKKIFEKRERNIEKRLVFCAPNNILTSFEPVVGDFYDFFSV